MATPRDVIIAWVDALDRRDAHAAAALYLEDATVWQLPAAEPRVGRQATCEGLLAFFQAFPDAYTHLESLFEDGEWAILEWSGGGTWRGEFVGQPPNGRSFT